METYLKEKGPKPDGKLIRWARWLEPDISGLPPVKTYVCKKVNSPVHIDGDVDKEIWKESLWTDSFTDMRNDNKVPFETRLALRWDEKYLYAAYNIEDPDIRAVMTDFHDHVYALDEDAEIFVEGEGGYFEMGTNALNNIYEIRWTWIKDVIEKGDHKRLEELFMAPNYLYYPARKGDQYGRHGNLDWQLPGLKHAVRIDGAINYPEAKDKRWTVEFALPWEGLKPIMGGKSSPPKPGDEIRMTAYRAHQWRNEDGSNRWDGWTWSYMGCDNIHIPERWNRVVFSE